MKRKKPAKKATKNKLIQVRVDEDVSEVIENIVQHLNKSQSFIETEANASTVIRAGIYALAEKLGVK